MSAITILRDVRSREAAWARAVGVAPRRWLWALALAASVLLGVYEAQLALERPGAAIRHDLVSAGAEIAILPWSTPAARVQQAVTQDFSGYRTTVDASGFPAYVIVTLHDLGDLDCRAARRIAERIEGPVVIAMEKPDAACLHGASLAWRIMP